MKSKPSSGSHQKPNQLVKAQQEAELRKSLPKKYIDTPLENIPFGMIPHGVEYVISSEKSGLPYNVSLSTTSHSRKIVRVLITKIKKMNKSLSAKKYKESMIRIAHDNGMLCLIEGYKDRETANGLMFNCRANTIADVLKNVKQSMQKIQEQITQIK